MQLSFSDSVSDLIDCQIFAKTVLRNMDIGENFYLDYRSEYTLFRICDLKKLRKLHYPSEPSLLTKLHIFIVLGRV